MAVVVDDDFTLKWPQPRHSSEELFRAPKDKRPCVSSRESTRVRQLHSGMNWSVLSAIHSVIMNSNG